jgi:hypothetical protein
MYMSGERISAPESPPTNSHEKIGTQVSEMIASLKRVTELQVSIWLNQIKSAALRIVFFTALSLVAVIFAVIGVIFLYRGLFHVLTDILHVPTAWALMIFAALHLVTAGVLMLVATKLLHGKDKSKKKKKKSHDDDEEES